MADITLETIVQRMLDSNEPEDQIAAVIREFNATAPAAETGLEGLLSTTTAAGATAAALPLLRRAAEEVATNPKLVDAATTAGKAIGGLGGILKAGPLAIDTGARLGGAAASTLATGTQRLAQIAAPALTSRLASAVPVLGHAMLAGNALDATLGNPEQFRQHVTSLLERILESARAVAAPNTHDIHFQR